MNINLNELDIHNRTALEIQIARVTGHNNNTALIAVILRLLNGSFPSTGVNTTYSNSTITFDDEYSINLIDGVFFDVYISFIIIASILGIFGNFTVLAVSFHGSKRLNNCRFLVAHLAFCDFLFAVMQLFRVGPHFREDAKWTMGLAGCKIVRSSILLGSLVGISTILIIALERYRGIVMTFSGKMRRRVVVAALGLAWLISLGVVVPPFIYLSINSENGQCEEDWSSSPDYAPKAYALVLLLGFFVLPMFCMVFMYGSMIKLLSQPLNSKTRCGYNMDDHYVKRRRKEDFRVVKILVLVVVMFALCVLPIRLFWVIVEFLGDDLSLNTYKTLFIIGLLPYPFHVAVNPLIYGVVDFKFRKRVHRLMTSCFRKPTPQKSGSMNTNTDTKQPGKSFKQKNTNSVEDTSMAKPSYEIKSSYINDSSFDVASTELNETTEHIDSEIYKHTLDEEDFIPMGSKSFPDETDSGFRSLPQINLGLTNDGIFLDGEAVEV